MRLLSLALLLLAGPAAGADPVPAAPPSPSASAPATADAALPRAAIEKLGQGDRAFLERDYRNALFAYMDAAYLAPGSAVARVKLGRAYLAMRYPERALDQAEKALALDPANADARKLADEARGGAQGAGPARPAAVPSSPPAPAPAPPAAAPRVFKYVPEAESPPPAAARPSAGARPAAPAAAAVPVLAPAAPVAARPTLPGAATAGGTPVSAAARYREGIDLLQKREFERAIPALDDAIAKDPRLAVAYAARASARFGLGRYREAAEDYKAAIGFDGNLGTPLYGLAECYRVLGDSKSAAEMYRKYAESRAPDVREDLRAAAAKRAQELK